VVGLRHSSAPAPAKAAAASKRAGARAVTAR